MIRVTFPDETIVDIEENVIQTIQFYEQQNPWSKEAGGVLIGKKLQDIEHYVLTAVSVPTGFDKRTRFSFVRSIKSAQPFINRHWKDSDGIENYIGEWHTHPEYKPTPSPTDRELIKRVVSEKSSLFPKIFLIIGGLNGTFYFGVANAAELGDILFSKQLEVSYEHI